MTRDYFDKWKKKWHTRNKYWHFTRKNEILNFKGKASFIGQWPDEDVVILKCSESVFDLELNENRLPRPFTNMPVLGRILLVRMDEYSEPQDFTIKEYHRMTKNTQPRTRSSSKLISRPLSRNVSYSSQDCLWIFHT